MGISFVTKEKVDIVNYALNDYYKGLELVLVKDHKEGLKQKEKGKLDYFSKNYIPLLELTEKELLDILVGDYEIKDNKQEKLFNYWKAHQEVVENKQEHYSLGVQEHYSLGVVDGVCKALSILGISIEKINC